MFWPLHIHRFGHALCHQSGGVIVQFDDAECTNPAIICDDCRRRYKNITGIDINNQPIDKALLRAKTEQYNNFLNEIK
ncbi:MAG: hypothetical protein A2066_12995 [Bacteroidetes bacterium GWB2_41_8]|nr:MAG: hypothetical protein A2066_12995 [Bacteroidetes bacterium GWB2_41_8]